MSQSNENTFFDLTAEGLGYLNRARKVTPSQGSPYPCVSIAALHGNSNNPNYTYLDCNIVGSDAIDFVAEHTDAINDQDTKVLVRFKTGDLSPDSYVTSSGENKGNRNHIIKSRLLRITWAKVGDTVIDFGHDGGTQASSNQPETPVDDNANVSQISNDDKTSVPDSFDEVVSLEKDDPNFKEIRQKLKDLGYRWMNDEKVWYSPEKFNQKNAA